MIKVRKATQKDAYKITEININTWKVAYKGLLPDEILDNRNITKDRIENMQTLIATKDKICIVAEDNEEVVGFITGGFARNQDVPVDYEIYAFYVSPLMQRKGVGKALLDAFKQELNNEPFYLYALKDNQNARNFYTQNGGIEMSEFETKLPEKYNSAIESLYMFNL